MRAGLTRRLLLVAVLFAVPGRAWGEETLLREWKASAKAPAYDCIPATELALGGVSLFTSVEKLTAAMAPQVPSNEPVNNKGYYILGYPGLSAHIADGIVFRLESFTAEHATPSGIRQGMSRDGVIRILGREPRDGLPGDGIFVLSPCVPPKAPSWVYVVIVNIFFDEDARVNRIEIIALGGED